MDAHPSKPLRGGLASLGRRRLGLLGSLVFPSRALRRPPLPGLWRGRGRQVALVDGDLVLLHLDQKATAPPLQVADSEPVVNDILQAIGYYYGVPTLDSRKLEVTIGSTHNTVLRDMLPDTLKKAVGDADFDTLIWPHSIV